MSVIDSIFNIYSGSESGSSLMAGAGPSPPMGAWHCHADGRWLVTSLRGETSHSVLCLHLLVFFTSTFSISPLIDKSLGYYQEHQLASYSEITVHRTIILFSKLLNLLHLRQLFLRVCPPFCYNSETL